jgi:quercetin dioxygenase-like cupin family protein
MQHVDRRTALMLGVAAVTAAGVPKSGTAQTATPAPQGVSRATWGKGESMLPGYKSISMRDVIYQPGAKTSNPSMPNDMVCHVPEGELRVKQFEGMEFVAKKGDVWTCKKGIGEDLENIGSTVAIMRIIDLLPS